MSLPVSAARGDPGPSHMEIRAVPRKEGHICSV